MIPMKYVDPIMDNYSRIFGNKPKTTYTSPMEGGDHLKLNITQLFDEDEMNIYIYISIPD